MLEERPPSAVCGRGAPGQPKGSLPSKALPTYDLATTAALSSVHPQRTSPEPHSRAMLPYPQSYTPRSRAMLPYPQLYTPCSLLSSDPALAQKPCRCRCKCRCLRAFIPFLLEKLKPSNRCWRPRACACRTQVLLRWPSHHLDALRRHHLGNSIIHTVKAGLSPLIQRGQAETSPRYGYAVDASIQGLTIYRLKRRERRWTQKGRRGTFA